MRWAARLAGRTWQTWSTPGTVGFELRWQDQKETTAITLRFRLYLLVTPLPHAHVGSARDRRCSNVSNPGRENDTHYTLPTATQPARVSKLGAAAPVINRSKTPSFFSTELAAIPSRATIILAPTWQRAGLEVLSRGGAEFGLADVGNDDEDSRRDDDSLAAAGSTGLVHKG